MPHAPSINYEKKYIRGSLQNNIRFFCKRIEPFFVKSITQILVAEFKFERWLCFTLNKIYSEYLHYYDSLTFMSTDE